MPQTERAAARRCNPVTLEILRGAVQAVQAEIEAMLERTAISAFIREKKDFYTAIFDGDGVMAVGSNVPIFGDMTAPVLARFAPDTIRPGDLFWYNDCYGSDGAVTHSNDQVILVPVFHDGRRCAFVMGWAHFADIGGMHPGSISPDATDIYQEGIIVPPTRLREENLEHEPALEIFHRNSRFPQQSRGDMRALVESVLLGARRIGELLERFGPDVFADGLDQLLHRTRQLVRRRLAETFPPGKVAFTDRIDGDGHGNGPFRLKLALTRTQGDNGADRFVLDATGTDDEAPGPVNFLMNRGVPGMALGLYFLGGDPGEICNAGGTLALDEVVLREGSLLRPRFPAPLGMRGLTMMRLLSALNGLVNAGSGGAPAAHSAYVISIMRGTWRTASGAIERFLLADGLGVGYGARPAADGIDAVYFVAQENYPVEFIESAYPVRLRRYAIATDSGGAGRYRGGCGVVREYEILAETVRMAIRIDGTENPPWGMQGGRGGGAGSAVVNPGTPGERRLAPLSDGNMLRHGDVLRVVTGGGGGCGHPFDRPPASVLEDVRGGFVSADAARSLYGVAVTDRGIDADATAQLRAARPLARNFHRTEYVDVLD